MTPGAPPVLLAHGIGGRQDLPIPLSYVIDGSAAALVVSFVGLGLLWRTSRLRGDESGRPVPEPLQRLVDSRWFVLALRLLGLLLTGVVAAAAFFAEDSALNPTAGAVYVLFWVGIVPASLLLGPVWRALNPLRTLHLAVSALTGVPADRGLRAYPERLGYWPAALALLSFTWLELVAPDRATTPVVRTYLSIYAGVMLLGAAVFGSRWFDRADGFEVWSTLLARLSPWGRRPDGRLVLRNPLANLDGLRPRPGLVAVVVVLVGTTAYDGFSNSTYWIRVTQQSSLSLVVSGTLGLVGFVLVVAATYTAATLLAGRLGRTSSGDEVRAAQMPALFAHSVVPIAVGYVVAHYFSLLIFEGQRTMTLLSDPLVTGADLLGLAGRGVDFSVVSPTTIAVVQVLAIVAGHVLGVVAAHDRAVRLFPVTRAVAGQLPLLVLMVGYTTGGLTLLFAG